ncbi:MAG: hypothetical protein JSS36_07525 [Proteobacteria bacterium]|nr:hypothetical protein [Pseudomonadota bacterium]
MSATCQFYLLQVDQCARAAAGAQLDNQRDIFLRAQAAWQSLADRELGNKLAREQREAERAEQALISV